MKFGSALATLALVTLVPSMPAVAAKDDKLPKCSGQKKRPANLYGTVLPTVPSRAPIAAAVEPGGIGVPRGTPAPQASATAPATNLFPPDNSAPAPQAPNTSRAVTVPAIGPLTPVPGPTAAVQTTYASC
jgi:hypothetical protein